MPPPSTRKAKKRGSLPTAAGFLHLQSPKNNWQLLPWLLLAALVLRVATALSGDFIIHPDEIMQYLV